jgi:hypothetical protein
MSVPGLSVVKHPAGILLFASNAMASAKETSSGLSIRLQLILSVPVSHMVLHQGCRLRTVSHHCRGIWDTQLGRQFQGYNGYQRIHRLNHLLLELYDAL